MNTRNIELSVIIPAYNEEKRIGATLADLERFFSRAQISHEIIVVSDGSTDKTPEIVRKFAERMSSLHLVEYAPNRGKGHAVRVGMLQARGDYRLFMDADNSVTIDTVEPFLEEMKRSGSEVVIGSIAFSNSEVIEHAGWYRRAFGKVSKLLIRTIAIPGIYDSQRGFKLFSNRAADTIFPLQKIDGFGFDIEILAIARTHGFSIRELPVSWDNPAGSKVRLRAYFDSFGELWRIYGNMLRGAYDPHRRSSRIGKASLLVLFLGEFPSLLSRLVREILTSEIRLREMRRRLAAEGE
ncbi:MAG TPA: dolichyl-phosphate beta-glucosyltransferase [Candidatus Paceibacterota bacterium]|nr:dolichyl-phosphate beta-glucosyltransferase [Candidatus Paceibacterota bacterium]